MSDTLHRQITDLCRNGDALASAGKPEEARQNYIAALKLLPGEPSQWEAATWIYVALGDVHFHAQNFEKAFKCFSNAVQCPKGRGNPYIHLRLGQLYFEQNEQAHVEIFERNSLDFRFVQDPDGLERYLNVERDRLINLERALLTLEVSQSVAKTASLEERVAALRQVAETAASAVESSEKALIVAKAMDRGVRSISGEIMDERLAQISPLLNELYQRLRPHFDWQSIEYSVRGDVRRFLSLKVGDGLNPQFVFSSGQRRAAGLAFLLSVHLARA